MSKPARIDRVIFPTKAEAVAVFVAANMEICETWGLDRPATGGEFDAVNEKLDHRSRVTTLRAAIAACIPRVYRNFSLAEIDLDTLNETGPARDFPFVLPDAAAAYVLEERAMYLAGFEYSEAA